MTDLCVPVKTGQNKNPSYSGDYMNLGKAGEVVVIKFLESRPDILNVIDWRELKAVREADVDLAIKTRDGRVTLAEIKTDSHLGITGNVLFEVLRINHTCAHEHSLTLGWAGRTPAQFMIYFAPNVNRLYIIKTEHLRQAMQEYTGIARKGTRLDIVCTDAIKTTVNILIPFTFCEKYFKIYNLPAAQL